MFDGCGKFVFGLIAAGALVWCLFFMQVSTATSDGEGQLRYASVCTATYLITGASAIMEGILVFGSIGFWAFIVAMIIGTMALAENCRIFWAGALLVAGGFALQKYSGIAIVPYVIANPWAVVFIALGYFAVGTAWTFIKWWLFLKKTRRIYDNVTNDVKSLDRFKKGTVNPGKEPERTGENAVSDADYREWRSKNQEYMDFSREMADEMAERLHTELGYDYRSSIRPKVSEYKTKIVGWIMYWPTSMFWTLIGDAVFHIKTFATDIYNRIRNQMQKMSDDVWKGVGDK